MSWVYLVDRVRILAVHPGEERHCLAASIDPGRALGGLYTTSLILIGQQFRGHDLAGANTVLVMMYQMGAALGPAIAGWSMAVLSVSILPFVLGSALVIYLVVTALWVRRDRRASS